MGTREVYEEMLRKSNLHHDPTINIDLGSDRCPRCLSSLDPNKKTGKWRMTTVLHDATAVSNKKFVLYVYLVSEQVIVHLKAGSGIGGFFSTVFCCNTGWPYIQGRVKGPKWLPFVVGIPPLLMFCSASVVFGGYMLPRFTQLNVDAYDVASSASHYGISLLTRYVESHTSNICPKKIIK